jgi:hypothetical protein
MFQKNAEDRLRSWREFRLAVGQQPIEQALQSVTEFWSHAPFSPYYLDPDDSANWPNPWDLIIENYYCDIAKCLGIVYTLLLTEHAKAIDIEFRRYQDTVTKLEYNLAWIDDGKYIVNLIDGQVVNKTQFDNSLQLVQQFKASELKIEK